MYIKLLSMQLLIITGFNHHVSAKLQYTGVYLKLDEINLKDTVTWLRSNTSLSDVSFSE